MAEGMQPAAATRARKMEAHRWENQQRRWPTSGPRRRKQRVVLLQAMRGAREMAAGGGGRKGSGENRCCGRVWQGSLLLSHL
jgi:hypothetical protein